MSIIKLWFFQFGKLFSNRMKNRLIILALTSALLFVISCNDNTKEGNEAITAETNNLNANAFENLELTSSQTENIQLIHHAFEDVYPVSYEETLNNFKKDLNIDREIELWLIMKSTYEQVLREKDFTGLEQKREVFQLILLRTMMRNEEVKQKVIINELDPEDVDYVLEKFEEQL